MRTVFDNVTRDMLIERIHSLHNEMNPIWGKMSVYQMAKHCTLWDEWVLGKNNPVYKQKPLGEKYGKMALINYTKDNMPLDRNMHAGRAFIVNETEEGDVQVQKKIWAELIADYKYFSNDGFIHDFFGEMTMDQIGVFAYKHSDHHLRQFGV